MNKKYIGLRNVVAVALCLAAVIYIALRRTTPASRVADDDRPEMVELRGTAIVMGMATQWGYPWIWRTFADPTLVVPLHDGDLVHASAGDDEPEYVFVYRKEDGPVLNLWFDGPLIRVNARPNTLILVDEVLEFFTLFSDQELMDLQFVLIEEVKTNHLSQLRRLAKVNPHVGIGFDSEGDGVSQKVLPAFLEVLTAFQPRIVVYDEGIAEENPDWQKLLAGWTSIETLVAPAASTNDLKILAGLPRLRNLTLMEWDPEETGPLPEGMDGLEALTLYDSKVKDLSSLGALPGLRQLNIKGLDKASPLTNLTAMAKLPALRRVGLASCKEDIDINPLSSLKNLVYVALPASTTEAQLSAFVEQVPKIRWMDLMMCEAITNLSCLVSLDQLEVLGVSQEADLDDLAVLKDLQFLRIMIAGDEDEWPARYAEVDRLRESLPDCNIVTSVAPCLGSGYLLMLAPMALATWILVHRSRRSHRRASA